MCFITQRFVLWYKTGRWQLVYHCRPKYLKYYHTEFTMGALLCSLILEPEGPKKTE